MNKIELAKLIGLTCGYWNKVDRWDIENLLEQDWDIIEMSFCYGKIIVCAEQEDLIELEISKEDMVKEADIKVCIKQVSDLLWKRAAGEYLKRIHNTAMLVGGK